MDVNNRRHFITWGLLLSVVLIMGTALLFKYRLSLSQLEQLERTREKLQEQIGKLDELAVKLTDKRERREVFIDNGYKLIDALSKCGVNVRDVQQRKEDFIVLFNLNPDKVAYLLGIFEVNREIVDISNLKLVMESNGVISGSLTFRAYMGRPELEFPENFIFAWMDSDKLIEEAEILGLITREVPELEEVEERELEKTEEQETEYHLQGLPQQELESEFDKFAEKFKINGVLVIGNEAVVFVESQGRVYQLKTGDKLPGLNLFVKEITSDNVILVDKRGVQRSYPIR